MATHQSKHRVPIHVPHVELYLHEYLPQLSPYASNHTLHFARQRLEHENVRVRLRTDDDALEFRDATHEVVESSRNDFPTLELADCYSEIDCAHLRE